jgi:hypothetical protein
MLSKEMSKRIKHSIILLVFTHAALGQKPLSFSGQLSGMTSFSPQNDLSLFGGLRYLPQINFTKGLDSFTYFDAELALNLSGSLLANPTDSAILDFNQSLYRGWVHYAAKQFEVRAGLQKIDFGSAMLLRPLQWFNQIDPRDPLQLTNGVYGVLGRYYFLNNANIWVWGLYGNERARGFDFLESNADIPEFGGRVQYPTKRGEIALSYHHRIAQTNRSMSPLPFYENIPENNFGIDGKWDIGPGIWFEATTSHKDASLGLLENQTFVNVGTDYTFGLGNGINAVAEHLIVGSDSSWLGFNQRANISAVILTYPLGFFDNLTLVNYYSWESEDYIFFLNYEHQFKYLSGYIMAYYNPETAFGIQQNELVNQFAGPGIRLMLVYNH